MTARGVLAYAGGLPDPVEHGEALAASLGAPLTVAAVAVIEPVRMGCCDLRSGTWNRIQRELAGEHLQEAMVVLGGRAPAGFELVEGRDVASALATAAARHGCDVVVIPRAGWLRRRLAKLTDAHIVVS